MKTLLTTLTALTMLTGAAQAAETGGEWNNTCNKKELFYKVACLQYAQGLRSGFDVWLALDEESALICIPDAVNGDQLVAVGQKYHKENPKDRHLHVGLFLSLAFRGAWPCKGSGKKELL